MNVSAINASAPPQLNALMAYGSASASSGVKSSGHASDAGRDPASIKKAASQFEAIILRQLLAPSMGSIMSGGSSESTEGGGVYGYMLTDALADNMAQGGGLGLARMLEKQLTPRGVKTDAGANAPTALSSTQLLITKKS